MCLITNVRLIAGCARVYDTPLFLIVKRAYTVDRDIFAGKIFLVNISRSLNFRHQT